MSFLIFYLKILFTGKMVLGLEIGRDIAEEQSGVTQNETPVRQSRRIAQLKIKEEADKRRIEEETLNDKKEKKDPTEKKKRKKQKVNLNIFLIEIILMCCLIIIIIIFSLKARKKL